MSQFIQIGAAIVIKNDIKSISVCEKYILMWGLQTPTYNVVIAMKDEIQHVAFTGTWEECVAFVNDIPLMFAVSNVPSSNN